MEQARLLREVIDDHELRGERKELRDWLTAALGLSEAEVDILLWEGPRAVLTELIPTLERRLRSNWGLVRDGRQIDNADRFRSNHPAPEFAQTLQRPDALRFRSMHPMVTAKRLTRPRTSCVLMNSSRKCAMRCAPWKTAGLGRPEAVEDSFSTFPKRLG